MNPEDVAYFSAFLKEFQSETDRGAALVGAALIDSRLERILSSHLLKSTATNSLLNGANAPIGTFSSRMKLAYALGLITELEYKECDLIRRIRNEFAHSVQGLTFKNQKFIDLANNLKANTPDNKRFNGDARQLFINSVVILSLSFWYRSEHAAHLKTKVQNWPYQLTANHITR